MTAATRYATALFELSRQHTQLPAVTAASASILAALEDTKLAPALANPRLLAAQRSQLAASLAQAVNAPKALAGTLDLLAANNRFGMVTGVLKAFLEQTDTATGITHVRLSSAAPLTDAQRATLTGLIRQQTSAKDVRLEETLDPRLQGGFRAFFDGKVWDASLAGNLARLTTKLRNAVTSR